MRPCVRERARERQAEERWRRDRAAGERDLLAKITQLPEPDRSMAERLHAVVTSAAPNLSPRTWYGMPAYANREGQVVCYFTPASKFKERYATFGFNAPANLGHGNMRPTSFALKQLTPAEERKIAALVKRAVR